MINVGIIGAGFIVPEFIEATKKVKGFHYTGIAARNKEKLEALKQKYNIDYWTTNNDEVLEDKNIDVIYVGVPNDLHYEIGLKALNNGKHVIMEKPFCTSYKQAKKLIDLAKEKNLIIFDAVTLLHMPNYQRIKDSLDKIGDIKILDLNFSQYSSRYDKFKQGIVLPALDYKKAGGALMDLGIYNINFVVGLFGEPKDVKYFPNINKKIDTSGVLVMVYPKFKVSCICAKDCKAPFHVYIQGDNGQLRSDDASSIINTVELKLNDGTVKEFRDNKNTDLPHYHEYAVFKNLYNKMDLNKAREYNELTLKTMKVLEKALKSADIKFR